MKYFYKETIYFSTTEKGKTKKFELEFFNRALETPVTTEIKHENLCRRFKPTFAKK